MRLRRVVVTGMGAVSPFGPGAGLLLEALRDGRSAVREVPELAAVGGLRTRVAALVPELDARVIERRHRRSMSRMSVFATLAACEALDQARLPRERCGEGRLGVVIGSTVTSGRALQDFFEDFLRDRSLERTKSTFLFQIMNHTVAANVAQTLGVTGRTLALSAACATSAQAVGYGCEMIALGRQDYALCGGADEFHPLTAATFDIMNAASAGYNDRPTCTPRPFDRDRDGVVCAEGAGVLLLESLDAARARGAEILGEIAGFATVSDPSSIANPGRGSIERCMRLALEDAGVAPGEVGYVNAHATATVTGDVAEAEAVAAVVGDRVPVSALKGHLGHTMAASGALELIATLGMLRAGVLIPTRNLEHPDPACSGVRLLRDLEESRPSVIIKNNFALGGINTSIVVKREADDGPGDHRPHQ